MRSLRYVPFPDVRLCNEDGLLAMGGDLSVNTLVSAYSQGIFPWFNPDQPVLWWSPDPRLVLKPQSIKISRSLAKTIRKGDFQLSCNQSFTEVLQGCALRGYDRPKHSDAPTWITDSMKEAYTGLHQRGYAHSIEVWQHQRLVGGLYGLTLGKVFFGESMFSEVSNASKVALAALCDHLVKQQFKLIDCQVSSEHLLSLGAEEIPRRDFLHYLDGISINQPHQSFADDFDF